LASGKAEAESPIYSTGNWTFHSNLFQHSLILEQYGCNPTGMTATLPRREAVLSLAAEHDFLILEGVFSFSSISEYDR
jgi:hypothetical protein